MAISSSSTTLSLDPRNYKRWSVEEYHRLSKLGLLNQEERTELIDGQIILMAAKGTPHVVALRLLALAIDNFLKDHPFHAITQDPIQLDSFSEPEPDLAILRGQILDYCDHHPQPSDICLVIEVADSTLQQDCQIKDKAYAQAGISEYWVLDIPNRQMHIYRQPTAEGYGQHLIAKEDSKVTPQVFPDLTVAISTVLPPA